MVFSSDDVCQGSHWLFQSPLCWRWWSLSPCLYLHWSWWWEVQTSHLSLLGRFPTRWNLSAFRGQTWVLCVLACWFLSCKGGRSSLASRDHFQCLLLENFVFWQCSLLIGSDSSLEYNQSGWGCKWRQVNIKLVGENTKDANIKVGMKRAWLIFDMKK